MLRIGIDYTIAVTGIAGLTRHTRALMAALLEINRANEYILIVTSDAKGDVVIVAKSPMLVQGC